jgi:hypothetical protein
MKRRKIMALILLQRVKVVRIKMVNGMYKLERLYVRNVSSHESVKRTSRTAQGDQPS